MLICLEDHGPHGRRWRIRAGNGRATAKNSTTRDNRALSRVRQETALAGMVASCRPSPYELLPFVHRVHYPAAQAPSCEIAGAPLKRPQARSNQRRIRSAALRRCRFGRDQGPCTPVGRFVAALTIGAMCGIMTGTGEGLAPMAEDEPVETTSAAARPTPDEVAALMNAAIATARAEGIAVPPDLARKTFAVTRKLARGRDAG